MLPRGDDPGRSRERAAKTDPLGAAVEPRRPTRPEAAFMVVQRIVRYNHMHKEQQRREQCTMATRLNEPAKARKSLPLTERDLADLERLRGQTPERDALSDLAGVVVEGVTEAALLHMIFTAGLRAIREKAEELAYADAAADRLSSGEADEIRRIARRRRPAWASEE
jgi:hypothetical protein